MTKLTSLVCSNFELQLHAANGFQGVLGAVGSPLKQLQLEDCTLLDGARELEAALSLLLGLEQLQLQLAKPWSGGYFPTEVLQQLPKLTSLKVVGFELQRGPGQASCALAPLHWQGLTRLVQLNLVVMCELTITANVLSSLCGLTFLKVWACSANMEPGVLAGKTRLQHLSLMFCSMTGGAAGIAQLLSQLLHLQQLTHLQLQYSLTFVDEADCPAAAYSALTASSTLQHLNISSCRMPLGVWQHVFPAGRQLPQLRSVDISHVTRPAGGLALAPDGTRLVSCCPGLQSLDLKLLQCSTTQLGPMSMLSGLSALKLIITDWPGQGVITQCVGQLTGLRELTLSIHMDIPGAAEAAGWLLLTQLRQLTSLHCWMCAHRVSLECKVRPVPIVYDSAKLVILSVCTLALSCRKFHWVEWLPILRVSRTSKMCAQQHGSDSTVQSGLCGVCTESVWSVTKSAATSRSRSFQSSSVLCLQCSIGRIMDSPRRVRLPITPSPIGGPTPHGRLPVLGPNTNFTLA
jgi:hypothetical protein